MNKTFLVTVSDDRFGRKGGNYGKIQNKVWKIFALSNFIDGQLPWTIYNIFYSKDGTVVNPFYIENKVMLDNPNPDINGRLYKPYAILSSLEDIEYGDYLIYNDVSPEMWPMKDTFKIDKKVYDIEVIKDLCRQANDFLVAFVKWAPGDFVENPLGIHTHHYFTLSDCIRIMEGQEYENSFQCASGMICIRKTDDTIKIVDEWLMWNRYWKCASIGNPSIPGDKSLWDSKEDYKLGCRHDQSILSILLNKRNWDYVDIVYNDISPYNFLNFCRKDVDYSFINSNIKQ